MSGGHFDYQQYRCDSIADDIEDLIQTNDDQTLDEWGDPVGRGYSAAILAKFREAVATLRRAAIMVQRIDYLVCGDDSEKSFHERWDKDLAELAEQEGE